jgi:polysaccharide deacetylase 2 family uncharacterized protein YibQ
MTAVSSQMRQVFSILKKRGLFFIDSRTTAQSLCKPSAQLLRIEFGQRDVFLDHVQETGEIRNQLRRLVRMAEKHGEAIGIGHPYSETFQVLNTELPRLKKKIEIVPASLVVHSLS